MWLATKQFPPHLFADDNYEGSKSLYISPASRRFFVYFLIEDS